MAERGNGLIGLGEMADDVEDLGVEAEIFGRAATGNDRGHRIARGRSSSNVALSVKLWPRFSV